MNSPGQEQKASHRDAAGHNAPSVRPESNHVLEEARSAARLIRAVIVDDSPSVLKALSMILEEETNVQLIGTATDGYHAVRRVAELAPDLVLMDLQLPGINGLEATRQIKARSQAPSVIMLTADDTPACRAAARAAGTDDFVGKQQMFTQLHAAIRKLFPGPIH